MALITTDKITNKTTNDTTPIASIEKEVFTWTLSLAIRHAVDLDVLDPPLPHSARSRKRTFVARRRRPGAGHSVSELDRYWMSVDTVATPS